MNRHLHRIIFNAARGCRMVVVEVARGCGKAASGATPAAAALALLGFTVAPSTQAQIKADPSAPGTQRPTILSTANGLPQVNIQTPSAAGVSRNTYSQFDVQAQGAILNNSRTNVQTQLGGWVSGNPQLAAGSARVILNEVNSSNPSYLKGYVEVAGSKAEVVIANPAGIQVNGGGFINASTVTLTTGVPVMNSGSLESYRVSGGRIQVEGLGLDTRTASITQILTRAAEINASLWANYLKIVTGTNQVNAADPTGETSGSKPVPIAANPNEPKPRFALDVAAIGGMYAGHIYLIGTEKGLGVNTKGSLQANSGDLVLQANGWLTNTAALQASGNISIKVAGSSDSTSSGSGDGTGPQAAHGVANSGSIYAAGSTTLQADGDIGNTGSAALIPPIIAAQGDASVQAGLASSAGSITNTGTIAAGLQADGSMASSGKLTLGAIGNISNSGKAYAGAALSLNADTLSNQAGAQIIGSAATSITTTHATANSGQIQGADTTVQAASFSNAGTLYAKGKLDVKTNGDISNSSTASLAAQGDASVQSSTGSINNAGTLAAGVQADGTFGSTGTLSLNAAGNISNSGKAHAAAALSLNADSLNNQAGAQIMGGVATSITTTHATANSGQIQGADTTVQAASFSNAGTLYAKGKLDVKTNGDISNAGSSALIAAQGDASVQSSTGSINNAGTLAAGVQADGTFGSTGTLSLNAAGNISNSGKAHAAAALSLNADSLNNQAGAQIIGGAATSITTIQATANSGQIQGADTTVQAASLSNAGTLYAKGNLSVQTSGDISNAGSSALIAAQGDTSVQAGVAGSAGSITNSGTVAAGLQADGSVGNSGKLTLGATGNISNSGKAWAGAALSLNADSLNNQAGAQIIGGAATSITTTQITANSGQIQGADTTVQATSFSNSGTLYAKGNLSVQTSGDISNSSTASMAAQGDASVQSRTGSVNNAGTLAAGVQADGTVGSSGTLSLNAASDISNSGKAYAGAALSLNADTLSNQAGAQIIGGAATSITTTQATTNSGQIQGADTTVQAASFSNVGTLYAKGKLSVQTSGDISNSSTANMAAQGDASVQSRTGSISNAGTLAAGVQTDGTVGSTGTLSLNAAGNISNIGAVWAGNTLSMGAANLDNSATGQLAATNTLITANNTFTNRGLVDGADTRIDAGTLRNVGTGRIYGDTLSISAATLSNEAETVIDTSAVATTSAAVIAARNRLDIGVGTLANGYANGQSALIYSAGDMVIGGSLDSNRQATGSAQSISNAGGTITAMGRLTASAARISNTNPDFAYEIRSAGSTADREYIASSGQPYTQSQVAWLLYTNWGSAGGGGGYAYGGKQGRFLPVGHTYADTKYQPYYGSGNAYVAGGYQNTVNSDGIAVSVYTPEVFAYTAGDPIWAVFGMAPPPGANPGPRPVPVCNDIGCSTPTPTELAAWDAAAVPWVALQAKLDTLRSAVDASAITYTTWRDLSRDVPQAVVTRSAPGKISAAGDMTLNATDSLLNEQSQIVAGGLLKITGAAVNNQAKTLDTSAARSGTQYTWDSNFDYGCGGKSCVRYSAYRPYSYADAIPLTLSLNTASAASQAGVNQGIVQIPAASNSATNSALNSTVSTVNSTVNSTLSSTFNSTFNSAVNSTLNSMVTNAGGAGGGASVIRTTAPSTGLVTAAGSSLFRPTPKPGASYLVETDPRFTQYRTWLGSDYMLTALGFDPVSVQKRLGDGFYEQTLIREQVAQLTGRRFLADFTSDEQQFKALMNAGITYARAYNLRPGITLTAEQVARLTSDMVWLVEREVTLADGTTQKALVPQLYAMVREGDLTGNGALLGGANVQMDAASVLNSGTIQGRKVVNINALTVANLAGDIQAQSVGITTAGDISNVGGAIRAEQSLNLTAGGSINVPSATASTQGRGNGQASRADITRVAGLYVTGPGGTLVASAQRDINVVAGIVQSAGDASLNAQGSVKLQTAQTSRSYQYDSENAHIKDSNSAEVGSQISAGGNLSISAGQDISARAASIQAGASGAGDLSLQADKDITLAAGQQSGSFEYATKGSTSGFLSSTTTEERRTGSSAQAIASQISGANVSISAGRDLTSVGAQFKATGINGSGGNLTVEGKNSQAFYEAVNVEQSSTENKSSSSLLGISLGERSVSDSSLQTTAVASRLTSTDRIDIQVGNKATLQGAEVQAKDIVLARAAGADPTRAGEVVLSSSISTTQTAHTEKNETAGVWQEMKGAGGTTQTASLTKLKGNVVIDPGLKVTVQTGSTGSTGSSNPSQSTANLQSQIQSLSSQPGLGYLKDLQANPNVKWEQVKLAHEQWSYSQQGLTPAGAALLSIAVAAYAPGLASSTMTSLTSAVGASGAAALNAGFVALQSQAAVALVNNGGDIGKTLEQLGSEQSIKGLLTAMATAGAIQALNPGVNPVATGQSGPGAQTVATTQAANDFLGNLQRNITNNLAGAVIDSAINGKPLNEASLASALTSALVAAGMAQGANAIGGAASSQNGQPAKIDAFTQAVAHAVLGCVAGAATISGGCGAGALGGVVGELTAAYAKESGLSDQNAVALAKTLSAAAGVMAGGGGTGVAAVNVAAQTGANAAMYNRMLHPAETQKARELAAQSGGKYTAAQIEEQMRLMGNTAYGEPANKTEVLTTTQAIVNNITQDPSMPKATDGKTVVEVAGQANVEIQQFIMANTKDGAGYIPGQSPYTASNAALNKPVTTNTPGETTTTAACANGDLACKSGVGVQQNAPLTQQTKEAIADGAASVSRQAGVIAAGATAATAAAPPQVKPITGAVATGATVMGVAADVVEQVIRPNTGQTTVNTLGTVANEAANRVLPIAAPLTNEAIEALKSTDKAKEIESSTNSYLENFAK